MNLSMFLFFSVLLIGSIWSSYQVWTNPDEYFRKVKERRIRFDKSRVGRLLNSQTRNYLSGHQNMELWFARLVFALQYIFFMFGIVVALFFQ